MRIYIDEAGSFVAPPPSQPHSFSLVLAICLPSSSESDLFYEFLRLRDSWRKPAVEVKGSALDESQAAQVIDLVSGYEVLVKFFALDMATHGDRVVEDFKLRQASEATAHLTPEHHPTLVSQLKTLGDGIRDMPNQLFIQAFVTIQLILEVIEEATLYFAQRLPIELGEIAWILDRKDRTITHMEATWTTLILPAGEDHFLRTPLKYLIGADYSYFDARYGFTAETVDDEMAAHLKWIQETRGVPPPEGGAALDAKLLLSDRREFLDSRHSLGLQLADMLATILRRALNGRLKFAGWQHFGKLLVRKGQPGSSFLQLGLPDNAPRTLKGHAAKVCLALDKRAQSMLLNRNS